MDHVKYFSVACGTTLNRQYYRFTAGHKRHLVKFFRKQAQDQYEYAVMARESLIDHVMRDHGPKRQPKATNSTRFGRCLRGG